MSESYGDEADLRVPVVLHFQPTRFEKVKAERLADWEDQLRNRVGLDVPKGSIGDLLMKAGATPSICFCPNADDCDSI